MMILANFAIEPIPSTPISGSLPSTKDSRFLGKVANGVVSLSFFVLSNLGPYKAKLDTHS